MNIKNIQESTRILGFESGISFVEAKKKWRVLAMRYHPDRNKSSEAEELFKKYKAAWEFFEKWFKDDAVCKWTDNQNSYKSNRKESAPGPERSKNKYYGDDDEKWDDYWEKEYEYSTNPEKAFTYLNTGTVPEIAKAFFDSYFNHMERRAKSGTLGSNTTFYVDALTYLIESYKTTKLALDIYGAEFSTQLWTRQNLDILNLSFNIFEDFEYVMSEKYKDKVAEAVNPSYTRRGVSYTNIKFDALDVISFDTSAKGDKDKLDFVEKVISTLCKNKDSSFIKGGDKIIDNEPFYKKLINIRPELLVLYIENKIINLDSEVWSKANINPYIDIIKSKLDLKTKAKFLDLAIKTSNSSTVSALNELSNEETKKLLAQLVDINSERSGWIIDNMKRSVYPEEGKFKELYAKHRIAIDEHKDVIKLNERMAVEFLNMKLEELNNTLYKVSNLCHNLFSKDKNKDQDLLTKLAESLGVDKSTLEKQYDPETQKFVVQSMSI